MQTRNWAEALEENLGKSNQIKIIISDLITEEKKALLKENDFPVVFKNEIESLKIHLINKTSDELDQIRFAINLSCFITGFQLSREYHLLTHLLIQTIDQVKKDNEFKKYHDQFLVIDKSDGEEKYTDNNVLVIAHVKKAYEQYQSNLNKSLLAKLSTLAEPKSVKEEIRELLSDNLSSHDRYIKTMQFAFKHKNHRFITELQTILRQNEIENDLAFGTLRNIKSKLETSKADIQLQEIPKKN